MTKQIYINSALLVSVSANILLIGSWALPRGGSDGADPFGHGQVRSGVAVESRPSTGPQNNPDEETVGAPVVRGLGSNAEHSISRRVMQQNPIGMQEFLETLDDLGMRIVPNGLLRHTNLRAVDEEGRLSAQAKDLFALSAEEIVNLNEIIAVAINELRLIEIESLKVTSSEGVMNFQIKPSDSKIDSIIEEFRSSLNSELGSVDGGVMWDLLNSPVNLRYWQNFGAGGSEVVISLKNNEGRYEFTLMKSILEEDREGVGGPGGMPRSIGTRGQGTAAEIKSALARHLGRQDYLLQFLDLP